MEQEEEEPERERACLSSPLLWRFIQFYIMKDKDERCTGLGVSSPILYIHKHMYVYIMCAYAYCMYVCIVRLHTVDFDSSSSIPPPLNPPGPLSRHRHKCQTC